MAKWKYNACPRCKGDLYLDDRENYPEYVCLQCGHREDTRKVTAYLKREDRYGKVGQSGRY